MRDFREVIKVSYYIALIVLNPRVISCHFIVNRGDFRLIEIHSNQKRRKVLSRPVEPSKIYPISIRPAATSRNTPNALRSTTGFIAMAR
jgi:hypothetical protein